MGAEPEMKPFTVLVSRIEANILIEANTKPLTRTEEVQLDEAAGRILAFDVVAGFNVPPFDRASMDGYAVKAADTTSTPSKLRLIGARHAGEPYEGEVKQGECLEIATGSPLPKGADAVVMVEDTKLTGDMVEIRKAAKQWDNIAPEGEDIKKGEIAVKAGEYLTPGKVGAAAALGYSKLKIYSRPRIAIYSTGTEIVSQGEQLKPGQVYDINSFTLSAVIEANGCTPIRLGLAKDNEEKLRSAVKDAASYDVAVFSGGSSVGSKDLLSGVVSDLGTVYFHGVQIKPGKPTLFGEVDGAPVFGMPGYPTSCLSNAYIFLAPALRKIARLPPAEPHTILAKLTKSLRNTSGREQFYTVLVEKGNVAPVFKQSGDITSMAYANGYIIMPIESEYEKGDTVTVHLLD